MVESFKCTTFVGWLVVRRHEPDRRTIRENLALACSLVMKTSRALILSAIVCAAFPEFLSAAVSECPPVGYDIATLSELRQRHFDIADASERQTFARNLLACLSVPDPKLRDSIAYEAYATWRHSRSLDAATWDFIESSLLEKMNAREPDPDGVIKPFAALVLAEAVKADRASPYLSEKERRMLLNAATNYLAALHDYRGFDSGVGWRHGVAHAADLLAELALSPSFGKAEMDRILAATAAQIVPADAHFYIYGESERLSLVVAAIASRDVFTAEEWSAWLATIVSPAPFKKWDDAFGSQTGLAKRHDTMNFLLALYAQTAVDKRAAVIRLAPMVSKAMQPLG
jgi:hypothetical protein